MVKNVRNSEVPRVRVSDVTASALSVRNTDIWTLLGLAMLGVRLVQGWVYWAGASRRLIYSTGKLDPSSSGYMAHKMNEAIPGAIFGTGDAISTLLHHPTLLYVTIIAFTLVELLVGLALIFGDQAQSYIPLGFGIRSLNQALNQGICITR